MPNELMWFVHNIFFTLQINYIEFEELQELKNEVEEMRWEISVLTKDVLNLTNDVVNLTSSNRQRDKIIHELQANLQDIENKQTNIHQKIGNDFDWMPSKLLLLKFIKDIRRIAHFW